ncbi:MAG: hypothetical protein JO202_04615 [Ktedonobacteraceae bacterium]|nr:hypothetical protein [Ktedonobacteraceae bacterium]
MSNCYYIQRLSNSCFLVRERQEGRKPCTADRILSTFTDRANAFTYAQVMNEVQCQLDLVFSRNFNQIAEWTETLIILLIGNKWRLIQNAKLNFRSLTKQQSPCMLNRLFLRVCPKIAKYRSMRICQSRQVKIVISLILSLWFFSIINSFISSNNESTNCINPLFAIGCSLQELTVVVVWGVILPFQHHFYNNLTSALISSVISLADILLFFILFGGLYVLVFMLIPYLYQKSILKYKKKRLPIIR